MPGLGIEINWELLTAATLPSTQLNNMTSQMKPTNKQKTPRRSQKFIPRYIHTCISRHSDTQLSCSLTELRFIWDIGLQGSSNSAIVALLFSLCFTDLHLTAG